VPETLYDLAKEVFGDGARIEVISVGQKDAKIEIEREFKNKRSRE